MVVLAEECLRGQIHQSNDDNVEALLVDFFELDLEVSESLNWDERMPKHP